MNYFAPLKAILVTKSDAIVTMFPHGRTVEEPAMQMPSASTGPGYQVTGPATSTLLIRIWRLGKDLCQVQETASEANREKEIQNFVYFL